MTINERMKNKNITKYRLSKNSGIPYSTINDICNGKARLEKCSSETIYKLSKALNISMESILEPCFEKRISFELFKSNICHRLKELGDIQFIIDLLEKDEIRMYNKKGWYLESLYLLAMLDYVSRVNNIPICMQYDDLRKSKLQEVIYPSSILVAAAVYDSDTVKSKAKQEAIPEFMRFNIVESEVRNVI